MNRWTHPTLTRRGWTRANSMVRDMRNHYFDDEQAQIKINNENPLFRRGFRLPRGPALVRLCAV